jgi:hypothetical protein
MKTNKTINYLDDTFENRVKKTVNSVVNEDAFVIAQYIVELEMRLESLGSNEHFDE